MTPRPLALAEILDGLKEEASEWRYRSLFGSPSAQEAAKHKAAVLDAAIARLEQSEQERAESQRTINGNAYAAVKIAEDRAVIATERDALKERGERAQRWIAGASSMGGLTGEALLVVSGILSGLEPETAQAEAARRVKDLPKKPTADDSARARELFATPSPEEP